MSEEVVSRVSASMSGVTEPSRRRMSIARALERFKTVIRRRSSKKRAQSVVEDVPPIPMAPNTAIATVAIGREPIVRVLGVIESQPGPVSKEPIVEATTALEVDDNDQNDVPLLPVNNEPYRVGISEEKAKLLFDRYGLTYQPRPTQEPPSKVRRVEKPVRLRMHWSCHECNSVFAQDRTCRSCGHRRCQHCARTPPQGVRLVSDNARKLKEAEEAQGVTAAATSSKPVTGSSEIETAESIPNIGSLSRPPPWLKADPNRTSVTADPSSFLFTFQSSGHGGLQLVHQTRALLVERSCHKCHTPMLPPGRSDCQACGHIRCNRCTHSLHQSASLNYSATSNSKAKAAPVLERVYKKPRQRIRWTCDQCHAAFRERDHCSSCGHKRCEHCIRDPAKKPHNLPPDPLLLRSVEEKLAAIRPYQPIEQLPALLAA